MGRRAFNKMVAETVKRGLMTREDLAWRIGQEAKIDGHSIPLLTLLSNSELRSVSQADADQIAWVFEQLQLPLPRNGHHVRLGAEGLIMFVSDYGVVVRIERTQKGTANLRLNDSRWVLKPLATIYLSNCTIEINPGCALLPVTEEDAKKVYRGLWSEGYFAWDCKPRNIGYLPIYHVPGYPNGLPAMIDRLSVTFNSKSKEDKSKRLRLLFPKGGHPQDLLHGPLMRQIKEAWPDQSKPADPMKMRAFWELCSTFVAQGKLIPGWDQYREIDVSVANHDEAKGLARSAGVIAERYRRLTSGLSWEQDFCLQHNLINRHQVRSLCKSR